MKFISILPVLALISPGLTKDTTPALSNDIMTGGKCTAEIEGKTGCNHPIWPWSLDEVVICRDGRWDTLIKCASRMPCWPEPEPWCRDSNNQNVPKEAYEKWMDPSWLGGKPVAEGAAGTSSTSR
ncbi:hypothetical protein IQ06DRAFT_296922 [Phaeosphaeriaceae sp. SRC1lsM3a]|nr:hypothetical protein IQ06DRAFT_296922 [Stagonospora sp. SRC1lsM3a]